MDQVQVHNDKMLNYVMGSYDMIVWQDPPKEGSELILNAL
jgi:hypothetical protein